MRWELVIDEIETTCRIGIDDCEQDAPQRLLISARIWADYPAQPANIDECVNYGMLHDLVTTQWPKRPQTDLLETLAMELFEHIFQASTSISQVEVEIYKPDIFTSTRKVGIQARLTRAEFQAL